MQDNHEPFDLEASVNGRPSLQDRVQGLRLDSRIGKEKANTSAATWLPWLLCLLMGVAWAGVGIRWYQQGGSFVSGPSGPTPQGPSAPTTDTTTIDTSPTKQAISGTDKPVTSSNGYIVPARQISVSPIEVSGRVKVLYAEEGKTFKEGDILAILDDTNYRSQLEEAKANFDSAEARYQESLASRPEEVEQAKAELAEVKEQARQAESEFKRLERDINKINSGISVTDFEKAKMSHLTAQKKVERFEKVYELVVLGPRKEKQVAAKKDRDAAEARVKMAQWRLDNCLIKAPVTGTILTKKAEEGNLVNPLAMSGVSGSFCDMADLSDLEIDVKIPERELNKIFHDQACWIRANAYKDRRYEGYVDRLMPIANRNDATLTVRIKIIPKEGEKQGEYLRPEMGADVTFLDKKIEPEKKRKK